MKDCIFCKIVSKEIPAYIIYEDELTLAFLDNDPNDDGHTLVIPKKHFSSFTTADLDTLYAVVKTKKKIAELLNQRMHPQGFNFTSNDGEEAFQAVFHYHEHVIPKYVKHEGYAPKKQPKEKLQQIEKVYQQLTKN